MDLDPEVAPLIASTRGTLGRIEAELLPMLATLDEDALVSNYSLDEQARLYLAAAFTMAFSLYSLDKLNHREHKAVKVSGAKTGGGRRAEEGGEEDGAAPNVDPQLLLKIERITDYIKKLREITELAKQQQQQQQQRTDGKGSTATAETGEKAKSSASVAAAAASRKRGREEGEEKVEEGQAAAVAEAGDDLGDASMFATVSRVPGETGVLVSRIFRHVESANKQSRQ